MDNVKIAMTDRQKVILKAMEAVKKGATISAVARQFDIPRSTLSDKLRGRYSFECSKGPATVLTKEQEEHLSRWIIFMAKSGFPVNKAQLLDSVSLLVKKMKRDNPFRNGRPGRHWFEAFIKRHPEVGQRVAQNLTQTRALVKESDIRAWFKEVEEYFIKTHLENATRDPRRIFNCDESAFFLSPSDNRVLAKRGAKNVYNVIPSGEKECVTVLVTANAAGELAPPMVLFKLKSIPHKISKTAPKDWGLGFTPKGWMTGESFYEYMTNVFYPWLVKTNIEFPIIFFLDGHCSHTTLPLSNFCREKNIQLVALYPNATHLIQPMDVAVFRPLKMIWKRSVYDWRNDNQFVKLRKENFCPLLNTSLIQLDPNSIKNGFRKCGLFPFDANGVDYSKCVTSQPKKLVKPDNANQIQPDTIRHVKFFESQINPKNLKAFYSNGNERWKGEKSLEGLFNVWRQMHFQNNLPSDSFNNDSSALTKFCAQETSNINELQLSSGDIGNFTGMTDILDSNLNSNEFNDFTMTENESQAGKIEMYENVDGILMKIIDVEIPNNQPSLTNFIEENQTRPETEVRNTHHLSGQVYRTIGYNPIYITSRKNITTNSGIITTAITSNVVETDTMSMTQLSLPSNTTSITELAPTQIQFLSTMPQSYSSKDLVPLTPPSKTSPMHSKKIKKTSIMADDTTLDYTPSRIKTSANMKTPPLTPIEQALPKDDSRNQPKTKYYGDLVVPTPFKDALFWPETPNSTTKNKVKLPSVITSDRWQIFAQNKLEAKTQKEENKVKAKENKRKKTELGVGKKKPKKKSIDTEFRDITNEDWFCRLCQRSTKLDMIECVTCKTWYHTICAEVSPNEVTFICMYCYVSFDE